MKAAPRILVFAVLALLSWSILASHASSPSLLQDSDTNVLLLKIREDNDPTRWFFGDWPLENHFYRPISTLFFELDNAIGGSNAAVYGWTNAILVTASMLLLVWLAFELFASLPVAIASGVVFTLYIHDRTGFVGVIPEYMAMLVLVVGGFRHGFAFRQYIPATLALWGLQTIAFGANPLWNRMIGWIPGRTASVMTVFALLAMAAYARYERLSAERLAPPEPGPLDPPATRGTKKFSAKNGLGWALLSIVAAALAFGSYEQAVMLPAVLLGTAILLRWQRLKVRWGWQGAYWALLVGYLVLRRLILPTENSGYQDQQLRFGQGVLISLLEYAAPFAAGYSTFWIIVTGDPLIWITGSPWAYIIRWASEINTFFAARNQWIISAGGYLMSLLAYLPMAWLQQFDHYHFWPLALRSMMVVGLYAAMAPLVITAVSRPTQQSPQRLRPAPGSLPRP
jgi:hypothetical protein